MNPRTHVKSRHLRLASGFSLLIAFTRRHPAVVLSDLVAAIYVSDYDRIVDYWSDAGLLDDFVANDCGWPEHRLLTWNRWHDERRRGSRLRVPVLGWALTWQTRSYLDGQGVPLSDETKIIYQRAEELSPYRVEFSGRMVPVVTPELILLALANGRDFEISRCLRDSGLLLEKLQAGATQVLDLDRPERLT